MRVTIRTAAAADIDHLVSVSLAANRDRLSARSSWDPERFVEEIRGYAQREVAGEVENSSTYVIESAGAPVGRLRVVRPTGELFIAGIQIHPDHQRQGIGGAVVGMLASEAAASALPIRLEVEEDNPEAKRLYLRLGFTVTEDRDDRELMEKRLST